MLNEDFDPLRILDELAANQQTLYANDKKLHDGIQELRSMISNMRITLKDQGETIDILINGLNASNKNTEQLLQSMASNLYNNYSASGQH